MFRVLKFRVWGLGFGGLGFRVFKALGFGFRVLGFRGVLTGLLRGTLGV